MPDYTRIKIADETKTWLDEIYAKGAVTVNAAGETEVHPGVRGKITEMHSILAAGDQNVLTDLEAKFDAALQATSAFNKTAPGTLVI